MVTIGSMVLHVTDIHRAAAFWTAALGYRRKEGVDGDDSPVLLPSGDVGPTLTLDADDRTHLDLYAADAAEQQIEIERLIALGARRVPWDLPPDAAFEVLSDPEGNLFCVIDSSHSHGPA